MQNSLLHIKIVQKLKASLINYPLVWVLGLAVVLRVLKLYNAYYGTTQELFRDLNVVYDFLANGKWPLLGPSASIGEFYFGAIYYYILTPFVYLFSYRPVGAVVSSTIFSLLSLIVFYKLLRLWFGRKDLALIGIILAAVSVYDIQNAYYISNPNLLPFFVLSFFYALTKILSQPAHWLWYVVLGLVLGVATQLHATALVILPPVLLIAIIWRREFLIKTKIPLTVVAAAVTYVPYIIYESANHFHNLKRIIVVGGQQFSLFVSGQSIAAILNFWQSAFVFNNDFLNLWLDNLTLYLVLVFLYTLTVLFIIVRLRQHREWVDTVFVKIGREGRLLLALWAIIGTCTFLFFSLPKQSFYFLVLWPAPLVLLAWFLTWLKTLDRKLFLVLFCAHLIAQMLQVGYFYSVVRNDFYDQKQFNSLMETIVADAGNEKFNVINSNLDQNMFIYYNRVGGYDKLLTRSQAPLLYIVGSKLSDDQVIVEPNPAYHKLLSDFSHGNFTIKKYDFIALQN